MEEKEIKEEGTCCGHKCKVTKNHVICILSVLLIISTVTAISLAFCKEGRGLRSGLHMKNMMEGRYDREGGRYMQGERGGYLRDGESAPGGEVVPMQGKRSPDVVPPAGSPVDVLPTNPTL